MGSAVKTLLAWVFFWGMVAYSWWASHPSEAPAPKGSAPFRLQEVAAERGLRFQHALPDLDARIQPILPQIAGTGAAVSVVDVNGDGWMDLYTVTSRGGEPNALFVNQGDGTFVDRAAEAGLADLNVRGQGISHGSLWADLDRDGDEDVVVYMWGQSRMLRNDSTGAELRFEEVEDSGLPPWMHASTGTLLDYDGDGDLDLFLGAYYRADTNLWDLESLRFLHNDQEFATNGGRNALLRNEGEMRFTDVTAAAGVGGSRWTYASAAADFDLDGRQDLYLANDYGAEQYLRNVDGQRFEAVAGLGLEAKAKSGMCVAVGDITNRGQLSLYVTNISEPRYLMQGNNLRLVQHAGAFSLDNVASGATANCGWAWGAEFGDLDRDGWNDLVVVNGFRSANPDRSYWYQMSKLASGTGRLIEDAGNWPSFEDMSLSGFQRTRILQHRGRGFAFRDIAGSAGIEDRYDGRALVLVDVDNDGDLDMVTANQNGPLTLHESSGAKGGWVGFHLAGRASNPGAVGARATLRYGPHAQAQVVGAGQGFCAQTDPRLHFGLGVHVPIELEILWPSGQRQLVESPAPGAYHRIEEPAADHDH